MRIRKNTQLFVFFKKKRNTIEEFFTKHENSSFYINAIMEINSIEGISEYTVRLDEMPSTEINNIEIPFLSTRTWVQGRQTVKNINIHFINQINGEECVVSDWINSTMDNMTSRMGYAAGYKKSCKLIFENYVIMNLEGVYPININTEVNSNGNSQATFTLVADRLKFNL